MKTFLFLIAAFLFINIAMAAVKQKRAVTAEPIVFEVEVRAPCEAYLAKVLASIQITSFSSPGCLPINLTNPTMDINDRNSHVFCRNIDFDTRSIFYFHEIFPGTDEDETPPPGEVFIVSWISPEHFIERGRQYTYLRRPDCNVEEDLCTNLTIVGYCRDKPVSFLNGYVATTDDRIYFIPPNVQVGTCKSPLNDTCCPYVNTLPTGICGGLGDACTFLTCDDGLVCTDDSCSLGRCMHTPVCSSNDTCFLPTCDNVTADCGITPKCSTNDVCKSVVCNNGACSYPDKCTSNLPCYLPTCNNVTGDCGLADKCTTTDPCKTANCHLNGTCYLIDTCISTNSCLIATCNNVTGDCGTIEKCTSNDPCKAPGCYANGTCYLIDTCVSTNSCLIATCDSSNGYCNISEKCTSNDPCKAPGCYANGTCYFIDTCVSTNSCMIATCDSSNGYCNISEKCVAPDLCTTVSCDEATGDCTFTPVSCADGLFCTTNERCNVTDGQCYRDVTDCSGPMATDKCILSSICSTVTDSCEYTNVTCELDNECYKNSQCNPTTGTCAYQTIVVCDDHINCTNDNCLNATGCSFTQKCTSDNDPCSVDYCLEAGITSSTGVLIQPGGECGKLIFCSSSCARCQCIRDAATCATINDTIIYYTTDDYIIEGARRNSFYCNRTCPTKTDFEDIFTPSLSQVDNYNNQLLLEEIKKNEQRKEEIKRKEELDRLQKERLQREKEQIKVEFKSQPAQEVPKEQSKKAWWKLWK